VLKFSNILDASHPITLAEIVHEHREEYYELTKEEKVELRQEFTVEKDALRKIRRPTPRGSLQDVLNVVRKMEKMVCFLIPL